ncbi:hypothetical protein GCM10009718_33110 [Isoptericola halotolerans]|uniref:Uncharacterized protein n=1 Tax=Isoptericola halotolerans TaxID=300560 RepID=A0ABX2A6C8_9MICO|nr:hypothetical protein [Isoptericola halotolerans]NOV98199.1 hypothetical protein [Isoptericola halotolerans]
MTETPGIETTPERIGERFWPRVQITGFCWEWSAGHDQKGYGYFYVGKTTLRAEEWEKRHYDFHTECLLALVEGEIERSTT